MTVQQLRDCLAEFPPTDRVIIREGCFRAYSIPIGARVNNTRTDKEYIEIVTLDRTEEELNRDPK